MTTNSVTLVGRLAFEPELKFAGDGTAFYQFRLLQTVRVREGDEWKDGKTRGFDVVCWRQLAERAAMLPKGMMVRVTGELDEDRWEDKETSTPRSKLKVIARGVDIVVQNIRDAEDLGTGKLSITWKGDGGPGPRASGAEQLVMADAGRGYGEEPF